MSKKDKITWFTLGFIFLISLVMLYFNISLTSLPTTFSNVVKEHLESEEDFDQIEHLAVSQGITITTGGFFDRTMIHKPDDDREFAIEEENEVHDLLNSDMRVYNGGRIEERTEAFDLYIHFEDGSEQYYTVSETSIAVLDDEGFTEYKVLDDDNEIFDYLDSLYDD
ncbi:hypothetical protein [Alkalibacillus haloalkaliphilus]|uniref:Uncharacterized protein n=1 Tax=Alkalibacillus haloalkaliphilus TaxID=94136 RepID=A0A511W569_9BACI|nr:hypothetical protein [Alkalibacillus haloalkaliphilus]GEN46239.1 hypothetical protein AHA02nite_20150 [Alkalibacillus haloalkaliphilus]